MSRKEGMENILKTWTTTETNLCQSKNLWKSKQLCKWLSRGSKLNNRKWGRKKLWLNVLSTCKSNCEYLMVLILYTVCMFNISITVVCVQIEFEFHLKFVSKLYLFSFDCLWQQSILRCFVTIFRNWFEVDGNSLMAAKQKPFAKFAQQIEWKLVFVYVSDNPCSPSSTEICQQQLLSQSLFIQFHSISYRPLGKTLISMFAWDLLGIVISSCVLWFESVSFAFNG